MSISNTKTPNIPSVPSDASTELKAFLESVKEIIEVREGQRGTKNDKNVTFGDLLDFQQLNKDGFTYESLVAGNNDTIDPPTNFNVVKGVWKNHLTWTNPDSENLSHIQIWCNTSNNRTSSQLIAIVTKPVEYYAHSFGDVTLNHYYWIRSVSFSNGYSLWVPREEMGGELVLGDDSVGETIDKTLAILIGQIGENHFDSEFTTRLATLAANDYSATITYYKDQFVKHENKFYLCINDNSGSGITGITPPNVVYWRQGDTIFDLLASIATDITDANIDIDTNTSTITNNVSRITANESDIASAQTTLSTHTNEIGNLSAEYFVKFDVNGYISGFGIVGQSDYAEATFYVDKFKIVSPGITPTCMFIVGNVDGVSTVGINGNLVVDDTILARHIQADSINGSHIAAASTISLNGGGKLTIGANGLIDIVSGGEVNVGTDSVVINGTEGSITVAPSGGITGNDYAYLNNGNLLFYYYTGSEHVLYNSVKRIESGDADSGTTITIPGYWKTQPKIILSPKSFNLYDASYSGQDQSVRLQVEDLQNVSGTTNRWQFKPKLELLLASGNGGATISQSEVINNGTASNWPPSYLTYYSNEVTGLAANTRRVVVSGTNTDLLTYWNPGTDGDPGSPSFYWVHRTITLQCYYNSTWNDTGTLTVYGSPSSSSWSGSINSGTVGYDITKFRYKVVQTTWGNTNVTISAPSWCLYGTTSLRWRPNGKVLLTSYTSDLTSSTVLSSGMVTYTAIGQ